MSDMKKALCLLLAMGFVMWSAVGFEVGGHPTLSALCYLVMYVLGAASAVYTIRSAVQR